MSLQLPLVALPQREQPHGYIVSSAGRLDDFLDPEEQIDENVQKWSAVLRRRQALPVRLLEENSSFVDQRRRVRPAAALGLRRSSRADALVTGTVSRRRLACPYDHNEGAGAL